MHEENTSPSFWGIKLSHEIRISHFLSQPINLNKNSMVRRRRRGETSRRREYNTASGRCRRRNVWTIDYSCFLNSEQTLKIKLRENGLQQKLPTNHPLLALYRELLLITHPSNPECVKNYMSVIRTFRFVQDRIVDEEKRLSVHWSELLMRPELVVDYLRR